MLFGASEGAAGNGMVWSVMACTSNNITPLTTSRRMKWIGHVVCVCVGRGGGEKGGPQIFVREI